MVAAGLRKTGLEVNEEVPCVAINGSTKRIDIIAINTSNKKAWIIDPTIRIEDGVDQSSLVNEEKKNHYEPTIPFFKQKYKIEDIEVIGLYVGARGTISRFFADFIKSFNLPKSLIQDIVISVIKNSVHILQNHLYNMKQMAGRS